MMPTPGMALGLKTGRAYVTGGLGRFIFIVRSRVTLKGSHDAVLQELAVADAVLQSEASGRVLLDSLIGSDDYIIARSAIEDTAIGEAAPFDSGFDLGFDEERRILGGIGAGGAFDGGFDDSFASGSEKTSVNLDASAYSSPFSSSFDDAFDNQPSISLEGTDNETSGGYGLGFSPGFDSGRRGIQLTGIGAGAEFSDAFDDGFARGLASEVGIDASAFSSPFAPSFDDAFDNQPAVSLEGLEPRDSGFGIGFDSGFDELRGGVHLLGSVGGLHVEVPFPPTRAFASGFSGGFA